MIGILILALAAGRSNMAAAATNARDQQFRRARRQGKQ